MLQAAVVGWPQVETGGANQYSPYRPPVISDTRVSRDICNRSQGLTGGPPLPRTLLRAAPGYRLNDVAGCGCGRTGWGARMRGWRTGGQEVEVQPS